MSLLVVNARAPGVDSRLLSGLADSVSSLIGRARFAEIPIAHLHQGASEAPFALKIPIGRFDPVFAARDLAREFPSELIEFLVHSPKKIINIAGLIRRDQLISLTSVLTQARFEPRTHASVLKVFDGVPVG